MKEKVMFTVWNNGDFCRIEANDCRTEIRKIADYVCESNNQDGPAHFLHEYCLHGEMLI